MNRRPELLSPAGNWECLRAAVTNGANAIYFGLERFNARMRADNFRTEELVKADVGCRNTVYNSRAQSAQALLAAGLRRFRVEFLDQTRLEAGHLIRVYRRLVNGEVPGEEVWREIKVHLQLGVTKGTLE